MKEPLSKNSCAANLLTPEDQEQVDSVEPLLAYVVVCVCYLLYLRFDFCVLFKISYYYNFRKMCFFSPELPVC